ncbi:MAG: DEAD/DEAH box helicase [Spirochaetia bacterium]|jgi:ATP-dependent RNA helicase RhlE|nr:DEAD/DEAH box helicase [Spirochaetia bacterium]
MKFEQLGIKPELLKGVKAKGYNTATPIQTQAIPAILEGKDILGGAQTGTGKTAAFALPILELLSRRAAKSSLPRALVLTPTRELAEQVGESFVNYGQFLDLKITKIYGGVKMSSQITKLKKGTDIVIATPGRLMDHLEKKSINLSEIEILVLDEADRMLDMGFIIDIKEIIKNIPRNSQNLLFSATYGDDIESLAKDILKKPISVEVTKRNAAAEEVEQIIHFVDKKNRFELLAHLINEGHWYQVLVFVKTKHSADRLASDLRKSGIPAAAIHGDKSQGARNKALKNFKKGDLQALIATDVAARGIDLLGLSHVVNYELPQIPEDYIHRIGRTGRAGKSGIAISLISYSEMNQLKKIEKILKGSIPHSTVPGFEPKHDVNTNLEHMREESKKKSSKYDKSRSEKTITEKSGFSRENSDEKRNRKARTDKYRSDTKKSGSDKYSSDNKRSNSGRGGKSSSDKSRDKRKKTYHK